MGLLVFLLTTLSFAQSNPDIVVQRVLQAQSSEVARQVSDLERLQSLMPQQCMADWVLGPQRQGKGATSRVSFPLLHKRFFMVLRTVEADHVEWETLGRNGFITRLLLEPAESGVNVTLHTYLNEPHKLVRKHFFDKVQPVWVWCYEQALDRLAEKVTPIGGQPGNDGRS